MTGVWGFDKRRDLRRYFILAQLRRFNNYGIVRAFNFLAGNATQPYFLFLEKDFKLIEPWPCSFEALTTGVNLIKENTAQVIRFRHRWRAGKPNWAKSFFKGDEERIFQRS
jgi:hypothetical protein